MQIFTRHQGARVCFLLSMLLVVVGFCYGDHSTVEVVGIGECTDCKENNIKTGQAFSGLRVTIGCKTANEHFKTRGAGELDKNGNFKVSLPQDIVRDGELKEECYAQLHSASAAPCPAHDGLQYTKIVIKSKTSDKYTLGPIGKLKFTSVICPSTFLFKHPFLPKLPFPQITFPPKHFSFPPVPIYKKLCPPSVPYEPITPPSPIYGPPVPPQTPIYEPVPPPAPTYGLVPPSAPIYGPPVPPPTPIYGPSVPPSTPIYGPPVPPSTPIYGPPKSLPPPVPIVKRCPPKSLSPPAPIYEPVPPPAPTSGPPIPPPTPIYEPVPPSAPIYGPPVPPSTPIYGPPVPPLTPIYGPPKPFPPPVPIVKPCPPKNKPLPPPIPITLPPPYVQPIPPNPKFPPCPPFMKYPFPPLPKFPPFKKLPPLPPRVPIFKPPFGKKPLSPLPKFPPFKKPSLPKIPPKYFHHPKFGKRPPFSPLFSPHP